MEDSIAAELEIEEGIDAYKATGTIRSYDSLRSDKDNALVVGRQNDCLGVASAGPAAPLQQLRRSSTTEATPLLAKVEVMSGQLSSPIEIAGIEGTDGIGRPWLTAKIKKKTPWWETPSVSRALPCPAIRSSDIVLLGLLADSAIPTLLSGHGRGLGTQAERDPEHHMSTIPLHGYGYKRPTYDHTTVQHWSRQQAMSKC